MSVKTRIEAVSGLTLSQTNADDWATDGAEELINLLPPSCLFTVSTTKSDSGSGVSVSTCRLVNVHKSGRPAREVPASLRAELSDTDSIYEASTFRPAYYREAGQVHVEPGGGTVEVVSYPDVDTSTAGISNFPDDLERLVVLYAARQALIAEVDAVRDSVPAAPSGYTKVNFDLTFTDYDTTFSDEDIELGQMELNKLQTELQEYQADIQDESQQTQSDIQKYQAEVSAQLQEVEALLQQINRIHQQYQQGIQAFISQYNTSVDNAQ